MEVKVYGEGGAALDRALTEFKRKIKKEGVFEDLRKHEYYQKPSVRRKLKRIEAIKRRRRETNERRKDKTNRSRRDQSSF